MLRRRRAHDGPDSGEAGPYCELRSAFGKQRGELLVEWPIADRLVVAVKTVESHIANIFTKLGLHDAPNDHRRVLAVLTALRKGSE